MEWNGSTGAGGGGEDPGYFINCINCTYSLTIHLRDLTRYSGQMELS